jgi:uncharacterized membrane-anchored protein
MGRTALRAAGAMRIRGTARVDRRTKNLIHRIGPGEIAVISHTDLDAPCAAALAARKVAAVVNAQRSLSGRFPHPGPGLLLQAHIPLVDCVGDYVMAHVEEGAALEIEGGAVYAGGTLVATGELLTPEALGRQLEEAKRNVGTELARFVENTLTYVVDEQALLFESPSIPALRTRIRGRHCLVVVRGPGAEADLSVIRSYVNAVRPVLIGVDGGADVLVQQGYRPHLIIGDMDSVSDAALRCGAELVAHAYPDGSAPGAKRLEAMGLPHLVLASRGTSEDVAMLLAHARGADLIAAVGTHFSLTEFLEKSRGGMSSTFLVRLKVGSILVDAKGISRLYPSTGPTRFFVYLGAVAALTAGVLLIYSEVIRSTLELWMLRLISLFRGAF